MFYQTFNKNMFDPLYSLWMQLLLADHASLSSKYSNFWLQIKPKTKQNRKHGSGQNANVQASKCRIQKAVHPLDGRIWLRAEAWRIKPEKKRENTSLNVSNVFNWEQQNILL